MSLIADLLNFFKSDVSKEWASLTKELREAKDEWKAEAQQNKKVVSGLRLQIYGLQKQLYEGRVREERCLAQQLVLIEEARLIREEIVLWRSGDFKN